METIKDYFANQSADKLIEQLNNDNDVLQQNDWMYSIYNRNYIAYYNNILTGDALSALGMSGEQGELVKLCINESRALIRSLVSLVTRSRLNFEPLAQTDDASTLFNAKIAKGLCQHVVNEFQIDKIGDEVAEIAAVLGSGFIKVTWNPDKGEVYTAEDNVLYYKGDIDIDIITPYNIVYNKNKRFDNQDYVSVMTVKNRWDLIALYPDLTEEIKLLSPAKDYGYGQELNSMTDNTDDVIVWEFYHKPTPALPDGRIVLYSNDKTVYFDGPNEYKCIPIVSMIPEVIIDTPGIGYPIYSNLLPLQEMLNHNASAIATNQAATAVQSVLSPEGSNINVNDLGGVRFITYKAQSNLKDSGAPSPLNLTRTAPEVFNFASILRQQLETLSGINSALRGNPPPGATSGVAIATLSANAIELNQSFSKAYNLAMEKMMSLVVKTYHTFASVPRTVAIAGKNNTYLVQEFKGSDLAHIQQVVMKVSNPMASTAAGRIQMAQDLLGTGLIKDVKSYLQVIETGSFDVLLDAEMVELDLIESENDDLSDGIAVIATALDSHAQHILKHKSLIADPRIRRNGTIVAMVLNHIQEHLDLHEQSDPRLQAMAETGKLPPTQPPPQEQQ